MACGIQPVGLVVPTGEACGHLPSPSHIEIRKPSSIIFPLLMNAIVTVLSFCFIFYIFLLLKIGYLEEEQFITSGAILALAKSTFDLHYQISQEPWFFFLN